MIKPDSGTAVDVTSTPVGAAAETTLDPRLSSDERRSTSGLALIFTLRTLGLFMLLPVFVLEAQKYPGGDDPALVGLAFGAYGLVQAFLQIGYGLASDRWGRKRIIVIGLLIFAMGSVWAALASDIYMLLIGRALQGAGAVSAAVSALLSDQTRDIVRTKSMAIVGVGIGLSFALSLVLAPVLSTWVGLAGIFWGMALLALFGVLVLLVWVPPEGAHRPGSNPWQEFKAVLCQPKLLRLNTGVWVLHAVQAAMWMVVPLLLVRAGLATEQHWKVYLPTVLLSFVLMGAALFKLERAGFLRQTFLVSIGLIALAQLLFLSGLDQPGVFLLSSSLFLFFLGFNVLEASQPSLVSRYAKAQQRGAALGVYNTMQALGLFAGAALGGWLLHDQSNTSVLYLNIGLLALWLLVAWGMAPVAPRATATAHSAYLPKTDYLP